MKYCIKCKDLKPRTCFAKKHDNADGFSNTCKDCHKVKKAYYGRQIVHWFKEYKSSLSCEHCGQDHPATLDFHHNNSEDKSYEIAGMIRNRMSIKAVKAEIAKCKVLCSNCHRILHWNERNDESL